MNRIRTILLTTIFVVLAVPAFGWGEKGHRIHGELTWRLLDKATREKLQSLLADETIADVANWADQIRDEKPETKPWHFVNLPVDAKGFEHARDCADGKCIVAALDAAIAKLSDATTPRTERIEALKWVVHLVGDIHQPLHASLAEDKGGNDVQVTFFGRSTNLHRLWDTEMIERYDQDSRTYAEDLLRDIRKEDAEAWRSGTPADWATESWVLANEYAYRNTRGEKIANGDKLGREYWVSRSAIVDRRLKQSAIRLAWILEKALAN